MERSRGRERSSEGRLFQTEGPTIEKALFCLVAVRAHGTRKSPLEAERRDRRTEQAETMTCNGFPVPLSTCLLLMVQACIAPG